MNLTKRQVEIVERMAMGETTDQIADFFGRSVETVRTQVKQARERVGARNIPHLVAISISKGFINVVPAFVAALLILSISFGSTHEPARRGPRLQHRRPEYVISI